MRRLPFLLLAAVLPAVTAAAPTTYTAVTERIDLDRPGALARLRDARPDHYAAVMQQVRHVATQSCKVEVPLYHAGANLNLDRLPCHAMVVKTSWPAQTELRVPLEDRVYMITVYLASNYRIQPAVETR